MGERESITTTWTLEVGARITLMRCANPDYLEGYLPDGSSSNFPANLVELVPD